MLEEEVSLTVGFLPAASVEPVITVRESDSLETARTKMELHDFSQLPVLRGKNLRNPAGVISWTSIGRALIRNPASSLNDCVDTNFVAVTGDMPLLEAIPTINQKGYVLVQDDTNTLRGIVTSADVGDALADIAGPFLSISRWERAMRLVGRECLRLRILTSEDIRSSFVDKSKLFDGDIAALTSGELAKLMTDDRVWGEIGAGYDRTVIREHLESATALRNRVMHFRRLDGGQSAASKAMDRLATIFEGVGARLLSQR